MDRLSYIFESYWLSGAFLTGALIAALIFAFHLKRRHGRSLGWLLAVFAFALLGLGGVISAAVDAQHWLEDPRSWAWWVGGTGLIVLFGMVLVVLTTRAWSAALGYAMGGLVVVAGGGLIAESSRALSDACKTV